jgi:high affinity Mn2+ porin
VDEGVMRKSLAKIASLSVALWLAAASAQAQSGGSSATPTTGDEKPADKPLFGWLYAHAQLTNIWQYHPAFKSPYEGTNSLQGGNHVNETTDATAYLGANLSHGWEFWWNPEMDQGIAPSNTLGVAGYVNGDGAKVGKKHPYFRTQRAFFRWTGDLCGGTDKVEADTNRLARDTTANRLTFTFGKFNVTDIFDDNQYAHDPKSDFMNWSIIDGGAFDYAADAWGYSYGAALEWRTGDWTLRGGLFDTSRYPNGKSLTNGFAQFQYDAEVERRYKLWGREGKVKLTGFLSRARLASFTDAIAYGVAMGLPADTTLVRRYRSRAGGVLSLEQPLTDDLGAFARVSVADGHVEPYEYADIDRSVQAGLSLKGTRWGRKDDTAGLAVVDNAISSIHQAYANAGGLGILIGDGKLPHPGDERIAEAYYNIAAIEHVRITFDTQLIQNPAYNRDRGPAVVFGGRLHLDY